MAWDDVLIQVGDFRLVRLGLHDEYDDIVQHHCDNRLGTNDYYCDPENDWYYCWNMEHTCAGCGVSIPPEMTGFRVMCRWER